MTVKTVGEQMSTYEVYHKNPLNKLTHFLGIPLIIFQS